MTAKQKTRSKFIVRLSEEERDRLNTLIQNGKHGARQLLKARVLLKADASDAGAGWNDSQIATALDTSRHGQPDAPHPRRGRTECCPDAPALAGFGQKAHL